MRTFLETFLRVFGAIDRAFTRVVKGMLATVLLTMVALVFLQVVLRQFFNTGISWADVASRHMVLWIAFLGAMLATRSRQHISIDLLTRLMHRKARNALRFMLDIAACVVCAFLAVAAVKLVIQERAMGTIPFLGIPLWVIQLIIPLGFTMMAIEYALGVMLDILRLVYNGMAAQLASDRRPV